MRTATPEQAAAIAAVRASFEPSVRAWYGLDPLTTSDDGRAAAAAVRQALRRTADLRDWSAATDEQAFVARPGPQAVHSVYAAREGAGRLAVSAAYVHAPADIRRIHVPGMSWDYRPAGRCWLAHRDVGPAPLPSPEPAIVHYGPMGLPFLGGPRGYPVGQFALTPTFLSTYDLTAKAPLSLGPARDALRAVLLLRLPDPPDRRRRPQRHRAGRQGGAARCPGEAGRALAHRRHDARAACAADARAILRLRTTGRERSRPRAPSRIV